MAKTQPDIVPKLITCPTCHTSYEWGELIRGCYGRRDRSVAKVRKTRIKKGKAPAAEDLGTTEEDAETEEMDEEEWRAFEREMMAED